MCPGCDVDVVVEIEAEGFYICVGIVLLTVDGESLGAFSKICVEDTLETSLPCCGELAVGVADYYIEVGGEDTAELTVTVGVSAVVESGHFRLGDDTVVLEAVEYIAE